MGVISDLKEQRSSSEGFADYCTNSLYICGERSSCYSKRPVIVASTLALIAGQIAEVVVGTLTLKAYPSMDLIPIYCLGIGVISIVSSVFDAISRWTPASNTEEELSTLGKIGKALQALVLLAMIGWFIAGNVWIFNMRPCTDIDLEEVITDNTTTITCYSTNTTYSDTSVFCHEFLFNFVYIGIALTIAACSLVCCPICCVYCCSTGSTERKYSKDSTKF